LCTRRGPTRLRRPDQNRVVYRSGAGLGLLEHAHVIGEAARRRQYRLAVGKTPPSIAAAPVIDFSRIADGRQVGWRLNVWLPSTRTWIEIASSLRSSQ
jgi:hypothetical protein